MELRANILLTTLALYSPASVLSAASYWVPSWLVSKGAAAATVGLYLSALHLSGTLFAPILLFVILLLIGQSVDLAEDYLGPLLSIVIGSAIGAGLGYTISVVLIVLYGNFLLNLGFALAIGLQLIIAILGATLSSFGSLAIGYHRTHQNRPAAFQG